MDDVADAADGVLQHVVGMREGLLLRDVVAHHLEQLLVEHDDQAVDVGLELGHAVVGLLAAALALELEGLGDHADGQDAHLLGHARDHRRGAGAGAAAHAGGDEQHVRAVDGLADAVHRLFGRGAADLGLAARAQAAVAQLHQLAGAAAVERLRVGVGADELHALHALRDHVLDGVAAAAADADHLDLRALVELFDHLDSHVRLLVRLQLPVKKVPTTTNRDLVTHASGSFVMPGSALLHDSFVRNCPGTSPWRGRRWSSPTPPAAAALSPRARAERASSSRPITVAERGLATMSDKGAAVQRQALAHRLEEDVLAQLHHARHHRRCRR